MSPENIIKPSVPGTIKHAWEKLTDQVNEVKRGVDKDPSTVFIGMHIITLRRRSSGQEKIEAALDKAECITPEEIISWSERLCRKERFSVDCIIEWKIGQDAHKFYVIDWDDDDEPTQWGAFPRHLFCFKIEFN